MKIGILTYHRAHNYGAVLQALATRVFLKKNGFESSYIDYYPDYHKSVYLQFSLREIYNLGFINGLRYIKAHILYRKECKQRYDNFESFIRRFIEPYCKDTDEVFDIVIYGSDQIWRRQRWGIGYNPIYFGDESINARRKITYAASMGILPLRNDEDRIKPLFENFNAISVREKSLQDYLISIGYRDIKLCVDPTLLLDAQDWNLYRNTDNQESDYVLLYNLQPSAFDIEQSKNFANRYGYNLKILHGRFEKWSNEYDSVAGPGEFLSLVSNAKCILSSSFHGVVFSIIFNRPFYASLSTNADRVKNLLEILGLEDNYIDGNTVSKLHIPYIDYIKVNNKLKQLRKESCSYLLGQL